MFPCRFPGRDSTWIALRVCRVQGVTKENCKPFQAVLLCIISGMEDTEVWICTKSKHMYFLPQNNIKQSKLFIYYIKKRFDHVLSKESWPALNLEKKTCPFSKESRPVLKTEKKKQEKKADLCWKQKTCQEWDSNPCPFGPVPETGALDQLGHLDTLVVA